MANSDGLTGLNLDLRVSQTKINVHSEFSLLQDSAAEGEVSSQANYRALISISGFSVEPEYERLYILAGYDHIAQFYSSAFADQNRSVESAYARIGRRVGESSLYTVNFAAAYVGATSGAHDDGVTYSASLQAGSKLSRYLHFDAQAGYSGVQLNGSRVASDATQGSGFFGSLTIDNRLNKWFDQNLRASTDIESSVLTNFRKATYVTYTTTWSVVRHVDLSSQLYYEHSNSSLKLDGETYDRYGAALGLGVHLGYKVDGRIDYRFTLKDSKLANDSYHQNQLTLAMTKRF